MTKGALYYQTLTLCKTTNFRSFQTERVYRQQFEFDENGIKFSKWVENTVGKGEIARYNFSFSRSVFKPKGLFGKGLIPQKKLMGKEESSYAKQFLEVSFIS